MNGWDWIEETRGLLLTGKQEALDQLTSPAGVPDNVWRVDGSSAAWRPGVMMEAGIESCYVRSVAPQPDGEAAWVSGTKYVEGNKVVEDSKLWVRSSTGSGTSSTRAPSTHADWWHEAGPYAAGYGGVLLSVIRGHEGSTPVEHPSGQILRVAPTFTSWRIWRALQNAVQELSAPTKLYQVVEAELNRAHRLGDWLYPVALPDGITASMVHRVLTAYTRVPEFQNEVPIRGQIQLVFDPRFSTTTPQDNPGGVGSGLAVRLSDSQVPWDTRTKVRIRLGCNLSPLSNDPEGDVNVTGLPETALDIPPVIAAFHLMSGLPGRFILPDVQSEPRVPGEQAAGSGQSAVTRLRQVYQDRVMEEIRGLQARYGLGRV